MQQKRYIGWIIRLVLLGLAVWWLWPGSSAETRTIKVATAKGRVIGAQMRSISADDQILLNFATLDESVGALLRGKDVQLLETQALGVVASAEIPACGECMLLTFYNYSDGGVIEAIYSFDSDAFVSTRLLPEARPNAGGYIVERVVEIAADDARVVEVLGDLRKAEVAMIPMSTWLADDACNRDWCVDLTFHDPSGSGKIFHTIVNMHEEVVARTFFTRGRTDRAALQADELDENAPLYTDGCHEQYGWNICWEMTPHDGLNVYDATFNDTLIFSSAKIAQVEAYYPSWPGGYRDEIGFASTVPPKFDTRITDFGDGFEIRQLFTEPFNWPNCICCYRYEQIIEFGDDGSFSPVFISQGPGCDELAEYRPFWRFNVDFDGTENDEAWVWNEREWIQATEEQEINAYESLSLEGDKLATSDGGELNYRWEPEASDPLALDEARFFVVNSEGEQGIEPGPADTYDPVRSFVNGDTLTDGESDMAIWYIPVLKTKRGGPWWCSPDPEPEFSPCHATLRVRPTGKLVQPTEEELAQLDSQTVEPVAEQITPTPEGVIALATPRPTPRAIEGSTVEEVMLNAGCGACHVIGALGEEGKVGPSLNNIGNIAHERVPGQSAEEYLYNSIIYPNIYLAPDCPNSECRENVMPGTYYLTLSDTQVDTLVDYMLTLRDDAPQVIAGNETIGESGGNVSAENTSGTLTQSTDNTNLYLLIASVFLVFLIVMLIVLLRRGEE